mmetsp:Transcript_38226/g.61899  ORF Transcript_38226/g.61899 Transcript_38226/m.61899 type:complete len:1008 (+) Transcript_38226:147-3170(+)
MERKLRPIWEALDVRNNKQALKLCNALIQKHPAVIIAKVFKALSLVRMGRREEALECMSEVKALKPTDDQVLSTMAMAYKELGEPHIAVTCYEDAWAVDPNNIEIGMQLFFNYAKQCDSVKMQQIAMKLYKQSTKAEHLFWSIASILLQTIDNQVSSGSDAKRMLAVAEGMLLKAHKDGKINNWEALQLYEDVLIQQGKYQNALDVASGPLGDLCPMPAVRLSQRASLLLRLENFAHSNRLYQQLLTKHDADDWAYHVGYLDTLLRLAQTSSQRVQSKPTTETSDQESPYKAHRSVEEGRNFIKQLQQQQESEPISGRKRGPFLAELELEYRLLLAHSETDDAKAVNGGDFEQQQKGRLTLAMVDYYVRFGTRPVCFGDLRPYLVHIASTPTWASDLHNRILAAVPAAASIVHPSALKEQGVRSEDDVRYSLCALFVERVLGVVPSSTTTEQVSGLCDLYDASLALGENLERRERRVGDDALLLVAHILLDRYNSTWDAQHVIDAVVVLEYGMQQSAYNFQFQLLLMRLYLQLGASRPAKHLHARLQLKHIQHDTLSHLVLPDLLRCGDVPTAKKICESIERFHRDAIRDIGENLVVALRQGTLSKVREFVELGLQLQSSAMRSLAAASWINIHLIAKALDLHAATLLFADTHSFPRPDPHGVEVGAAKAKWNDDLQVLVSWNRNTPRSTSAPSQSPSPSPSPDASLTTPPPMGSPTFPVSYRPVPETDADREEIARMHSALALHSLSENRLLWLKVTIAQQTLMRSAMDGTGVGVVAGARPAVHMWPLISMLGATLHSLRVILYEPPSSSSPSPSPSRRLYPKPTKTSPSVAAAMNSPHRSSPSPASTARRVSSPNKTTLSPPPPPPLPSTPSGAPPSVVSEASPMTTTSSSSPAMSEAPFSPPPAMSYPAAEQTQTQTRLPDIVSKSQSSKSPQSLNSSSSSSASSSSGISKKGSSVLRVLEDRPTDEKTPDSVSITPLSVRAAYRRPSVALLPMMTIKPQQVSP